MPVDRVAIHDQFFGEMKKARERILTTADGEVGWLLKFIQTDLDTLTASEWMVLAFEIASFVDDVANRRGADIATEAGWSVRSIPGEGFRGTLPSRGEAKEIQAMVLGSLEKLWDTAVAAFTFPQFTIIVTLPVDDERKGSVFVATKRKVKEFEYRFAHLLVDYSGRIRRCPECQRIYLAIRVDQIYCGPRCQTRVATRKWREHHKADQRKESHRGKKRRQG
ncbi:MAG: hypothetical protein HRU82_18645 [Nitrospira sp.]|nr:MAG: hypothetical protein HRU82_18645 [Nitrospira sp.]